VRRLVATALDADVQEKHESAEFNVYWSPTEDDFVRSEIRLTQAERELVARRASAVGLSRNRWIVALIRAQLINEPHFSELEMKLLAESNQHLAQVNRRLSEISRSSGRQNPDFSNANDTSAMRQRIDAHLRAVVAMVHANLDRWRQ
jgi:hypothetical protein